MKALAPNLIVDAIEPCLPFWIDRLGFTLVDEVREGDVLGFVILRCGSVRLMLQSRASVEADVAPLASGPYRAVLYLTVDDLSSVRTALADYPKIVPERTTFYGAQEIIVADPAGNVVFFAQHGG